MVGAGQGVQEGARRVWSRERQEGPSLQDIVFPVRCVPVCGDRDGVEGAALVAVGSWALVLSARVAAGLGCVAKQHL